MTTKRSLERRLDDTSDIVLGNLETEDRLRLFIQEAAEGREERIKQLTETAPRHQYTTTDLAYADGMKQLVTLSLLARHQLQQNYLAITDHETSRDKYMVLMLLNEALSRLSRAFDIGENGAVDVPARDGAQDEPIDPDTAYLRDKYRELWGSISADLLLDEDDRSIPYFSNLAAGGLLAYPADYSAFDGLDGGRVPSEVHLSELRLLIALVDLYINFHGWRLFTEDNLDVSLDEFLGISIPGNGDDTAAALSVPEIDEQQCRNILSLKEDYLKAYPSLLDEWFEDSEEIDPDLDARAQAYADNLAEDSDLPL